MIYPRETLIYTIAVTLAVRSHLFSYRTQKLSSLAPKILDWRRSGKIGCCCIQKEELLKTSGSFCFRLINERESTTISRPDNRYAIETGKMSQSKTNTLSNKPFLGVSVNNNKQVAT